MDPHTHDHKQLIINTRWGESSSSLVENMASRDHHQHSHIFFHDQQHLHVLPSSLDHHSSVWQSSSSDHNNYIIPFSHSNQLVSSPSASSAACSLFFAGSDPPVGPPTNYHHQLTLDHQFYSHHFHRDQDEQDEEGGNRKDLLVFVNEEDEGGDNQVDEELGAMKEMMYKIAAMQPVDIDPSTIPKPKRRNVRISDDPQSVAARHRRERISEKMRVLQKLVPGGTKMDTASMLDEAIRYVKFLKRQIKHLQQDQNHVHDEQLPPTSSAFLKSSSLHTTSPVNRQYLTVTNNQQQCARFVAAASPPTATNHNCSMGVSALLHRDDHPETEKSSDTLNICTSNNSKVHPCMDHNNSIVIQTHRPQMDLFNQATRFVNQR